MGKQEGMARYPESGKCGKPFPLWDLEGSGGGSGSVARAHTEMDHCHNMARQGKVQVSIYPDIPLPTVPSPTSVSPWLIPTSSQREPR